MAYKSSNEKLNIKTEASAGKLGVYVHIPFCRTKCLYCDFCSFAGSCCEKIEPYIDALLSEMDRRSAECKDLTVDTVYFGGGTPSLLTTGQIERIMNALHAHFSIDEGAEITLECNPMSVREHALEYFGGLRALGINRLSVGVQSALDEELKLIGRRHGFNGARDTYFAAREAGFENISLDLMLGLPSQTLRSLEHSVRALCELAPEHISIYSLQLEEGTALYRLRDKFNIPDANLSADMYELAVRLMAKYGYEHYEISNFSKKGKESRHNKKYWALEQYLGLGLSAHSDIFDSRLENTKNLDDYLAGNFLLGKTEISEREREFEYVMLGLRTAKGISKADFFERFGIDFDQKYGERVKKIEKMGFFARNDENLALNERGFEVSNEILVQILDFEY